MRRVVSLSVLAEAHLVPLPSMGETAAPQLELLLPNPVANLPPATRGGCSGVPRPCNRLTCRHHLWLKLGDDRPGRRHAGRPPPAKLRRDRNADPNPPSCVLDLVESGEEMLVDDIAKVMQIKRSQVRSILAKATAKLRKLGMQLREGT